MNEVFSSSHNRLTKLIWFCYITIWVDPLIRNYLGGPPLWAMGSLLILFYIIIEKIRHKRFQYASITVLMQIGIASVVLNDEPVSELSSYIVLVGSFSSLFLLFKQPYYEKLGEGQSFGVFFRASTLILAIYGAFQASIYITLGETSFLSSVYRGIYNEYGRYISSFYQEPSFLALHLISALFFFLVVEGAKKSDWKYIAMIIAMGAASGSLNAALGITYTFICFFLLKKQTKAFLLCGLVVVLISSNTSMLSRMKNEVIASFELLGASPTEETYASSGSQRVVREYNWIAKTLTESPIMGFGSSYGAFSATRTASLNAFAEIIVRYGLLGLGVFLTSIFFIIFSEFRRGSILALSYILVYWHMDGAITRLEFWLPQALLLISIKNIPKNV